MSSFDGDVEAGEDRVHDLPSPEQYKANMSGLDSSTGIRLAKTNTKSDSNAETIPSGENHEADSYDHDQLPNVDEYKASTNASSISSEKGGSVLYYLAFFLLLVVLTIAIVVPVVLSNDKDSSKKQLPENAPISAPVDAPFVPSPERRQNIIDYLTVLGISSEDRLLTPGTPQNKALEWLAVDAYGMEIPNIPKRYSRFVERYVLAVFYYATNGDSWIYKLKFLSAQDHCNWNNRFLNSEGEIVTLGVASCTSVLPADGVVSEDMATELVVYYNDISGSLPSEIQFLHRLEELSVQYNPSLGGDMNFGLHNLSRLKTFGAQYCGLTGTIPPQLGALQELTSLGLANNKLVGSLPDGLFELTNLKFIYLDDNNLEGDIARFGVFVNMQSLYVEDNLLTGQLTDGLIEQWKNNLIDLDISRNLIDSTLPSTLFTMSNLEVADLHANSFRGPIPDPPSVNIALKFLALYDNDLTGLIPESIKNLGRLRHLDVSKNMLEIPLPDTLGQLTELRYLFMGQNDFFRHEVPSFLWTLTNLEELSMKNNTLTGSVPSDFGTLTSLKFLDLDANRLVGTIPAEIGQLTSLDVLLLNRNSLSGELPSTFSSLSNLETLLIDHNKINGTADVICTNSQIDMSYFVADCEGPMKNIECDCCDLCCSGLNATCNQLGWHANLDPIWEYDYTREEYFNAELIAGDD